MWKYTESQFRKKNAHRNDESVSVRGAHFKSHYNFCVRRV